MPGPSQQLHERLLAFGESIRLLRRRVGLSQEELAHAAGLHRTYVGSIERGERNLSIGNAWALADALDASLADLLSPMPGDDR
ncbi:helix-turn-helix transcriptional regulator [Nocardioides sp. S-58]|uniref:Helix-turn-helix transcriptional regulator n=1 Tax=Nocardioides renjunii TaxID=3095075 RepID=A0ABU5KBK2_9ACTN|nr:helix-turn-helix transcriptional regulator [Nocardioides sp. S-58]MDZ5662353.1 helix-turn-helix transcriptional regulator [Nocardioides sp. S-58]